MKYLWDPESLLFKTETVQDFPYSDGAEVESRLFHIVQGAGDLTTFSRELAAAITDWPSEYHLSSGRHCLLRPLGIGERDRVLELGCGCGAITRFLGEVGAQVTAVEGSLRRARIAAERCRDLPNVRVFVDDLLRFEIEDLFDYVLLIGVLEYAQLSGVGNAFEAQLGSAARCLSPDGKLVVAIENKFGLKYFNGCAEDHVGAPYFGVQDLYSESTARTFGRRELLRLIASAGFAHHRLYFPFPDYKFPSVILSEDAFKIPGFEANDLLARVHARDYSGVSLRAFDEALVMSALEADGLLPELSNSFLLVASKSQPLPLDDSVAAAYSISRAPQYATETKFLKNGSGVEVAKQALDPSLQMPELRSGEMRFVHCLGRSKYVLGRQLLWKILKARASSTTLDSTVQALLPWIGFLLQHSVAVAGADVTALRSYVVSGNMADCTPFNLLETARGLMAIDLEWHSDNPIPLGWVLTRGLLHTLSTGTPIDNGTQTFMEIMVSLCQRVGLAVERAQVVDWLQTESVFQAEVCGRPCREISLDSISNGLRSTRAEIAALHSEAARLSSNDSTQRNKISHLQTEIAEREARIKETLILVAHREHEIRMGEQETAGLKESARQERASRDRQFRQELSRSERMFREELETRENQLHQKQVEVQQLKQELNVASSRLKAIEESKVWRATAFLRQGAPGKPGVVRWIRHVVRAVWWTVTLQMPSRLRARHRLFSDRRVVLQSELFDPSWYMSQYQDVARAGWDPALHYVLFGATEKRNPSPKFDSARYLLEYQDVAAAGANPLVHYLRSGREEGRRTWHV